MSYSEDEVAKVVKFFSLFCILNLSCLFGVHFHDYYPEQTDSMKTCINCSISLFVKNHVFMSFINRF